MSKPDPDKAARKRIEDILKARRRGKEEMPTFRGGRNTNQIADDFSTKIIAKMNRDNISSLTITGSVMRAEVGDPENQVFRSRCRVHGLKIVKDNYTNSYTVSKFDRVEKELKKIGKQSKSTGL